MLGQPGQRREQRVDEPVAQPAGGPLFQRSQVQVQPDDREVGVETGPDVDGPINDLHGQQSIVGGR